ncbi:hypothetical protein FRZ06_19440 [Anoxybacterium hadale]|uniref:Uncharacterized protein n=1 Tax=Anoxybacterium hadale TaxID=3408580 RepID=A0ACD1AFS8_9FIRM|nr:hypothetical protein FRZ06_19440 [Clostridiales bacterium]
MRKNSEKLLDEISMIDDKLIAEADTHSLKGKPGTKKKNQWIGWAVAAAACAVIALTIGFLPIEQEPSPIPSPEKPTVPSPGLYPELPILTLNENMGDYGFEGFLAHNAKELSGGNPWSEDDNITTLPVFRNPVSYDQAGMPVKGLSMEEMKGAALDVATSMGLDVNSASINLQEDEVVITSGDVAIKTEANGAVRIVFENGIKLPKAYRFTFYDTSEQQAREVMNYLLKEYQHVSGIKSPSLDLFGDYNIYGQRTFSYEAFESEGNITDRILGYNFNRISFSPDEDGKLWIIDRQKEDLSNKLGDYPIITVQKARELLLQKKYLTSVPEKMPGEKMIAGVELIYRTTRYDEIFMPYYRFLVELPTMKIDGGLKTFGAFYVPAVDERYLANMPLWNENFN